MREKKLQLLQEVMGRGITIGKETLFFCKKCDHHKPKLSVNIEKNKFKCWICNFSGKTIFALIKKYGNSEQIFQWSRLSGEVDLAEKEDLKSLLINPKEEEVEITFDLPKEFISLVGNKDLISMQPRKYLYNRGIDDKDILEWKIGFAIDGEYNNRIIIPSFNLDGKVNYFISRSYNDDYIKYKNPPITKNIIFNELFLDFRKPLVIVEGVFDAIKSGENSIPLLGSSLSQKSKLFIQIVTNNTKVFLALDPDARVKENKIIKDLLLYGIEIYKVPITPFSDVGEMSKDEFIKRKREATMLNNEKFLLYRMINENA